MRKCWRWTIRVLSVVDKLGLLMLLMCRQNLE